MWFISFRDLQYRQRRFMIAITGTALVFAMGLLGSGMSASFRAEVARTMDAVGADAWVIPRGSAGPFSSFGLLEAGRARAIARMPSVERADPIAIVHHSIALADRTLDVTVIGARTDGLGTPPVVEGRVMQGPAELVADRSAGFALGEQIDIGGGVVTIVGLTDGLSLNAGTPNIYARLADLQLAMFDGDRVATAIVTRGIPARAPAGLSVITDEAARADVLRPLKKAIGAIDMVRFLLWLVAASIIGAIVYLSTLERVRDFAVLRAVGASARELFTGLAAQAVVVSVGAAVVSVGIALALAPMFPLPIEIPRSALLLLPLVAIAVGIVASTTGLRRATSVDPALAFGG